MTSTISRRQFISAAAAGSACLAVTGQIEACSKSPTDEPWFEISLAQWSLHRSLNANKITNLNFPEVAKSILQIEAIEFVNSFFKNEVGERGYLQQLKDRCDDLGVKSLLIMVDGEGALGDPDESKRKQAIDNHRRWLEAAKFLGCHSIRVNAASNGSYDEQIKLAADGLARLSEVGKEFELNVIVENHGGLSSNGAWLAKVIKTVDMPNCGTLPDFGNFHLGDGKWYDRYQGVAELMPFAKAVSAKSHEFDEQGNETKTDYLKMLRIVKDAGYRGHIGIEYEGSAMSEFDGIRATRDLLIRCRMETA